MSLVSTTIHFTHNSCRTIMPQKKRNTYPGANNVTIEGKNKVSNAANVQCVKHPRDWP